MKKTLFLLLLILALLLSACAKGQESCPAEEEPMPSTPVEMFADGDETVPEEPEAPITEEKPEKPKEEPVPVDPTCGEIPLLGDTPPVLFVEANGEISRAARRHADVCDRLRDPSTGRRADG